jgi:hypothetical protein
MTLAINTLRRRSALGVALVALLAGVFGPTALANASPTLSLSSNQGNGQWVANGGGFAASSRYRAVDVQLWIQNVPSWTTLEHQSNIATSRPFCYLSGGVYHCVAGGQLTAQGLEGYIAPGPGVLARNIQ